MIPKGGKTNLTSERCPCPSLRGQIGWFLRFLPNQKTQWCVVKQLCYRTCNILLCWSVQTHINTSAKSHINPFYSEEVDRTVACWLTRFKVQPETCSILFHCPHICTSYKVLKAFLAKPPTDFTYTIPASSLQVCAVAWDISQKPRWLLNQSNWAPNFVQC